MKLLLALALPLLAQQAPRPAWEIAPYWTCEMTKIRVCKGLGGTCELLPNTARFFIDFPAERFGVEVPTSLYTQSAAATPARVFTDQIVGRAWFAPDDDATSFTTLGFTKIVFDSGDSATLGAVPGPDGKSHGAIVTRNQLDTQSHYYGACRPDAAKP